MVGYFYLIRIEHNYGMKVVKNYRGLFSQLSDQPGQTARLIILHKQSAGSDMNIAIQSSKLGQNK